MTHTFLAQTIDHVKNIYMSIDNCYRCLLEIIIIIYIQNFCQVDDVEKTLGQ